MIQSKQEFLRRRGNSSLNQRSIYMGTKMVMSQISTRRTLPEVKDAVGRSLFMLGGAVTPAGDGFWVIQGTNGVNFAFAAKFDCYINIRQVREDLYEVMGTVNWSPNNVFWAFLVIGLFTGIGLAVPLLYLFIDPTAAYTQALYQAQMTLH
jgi:hypothetical protein